jgi:predicted TIM-barrel fold metal-dependent hydrolase
MDMNAQVQAPLVDCHAHVYTTDMPLSGTAWHHPPEDATIDMYLDQLNAHGIKHAVLAAASLYDDYNDYMIESVRRNPRLRTTVIVRPDTSPYILKQMKADGVVGVRFQWRNVDPIPDLLKPEYRKFLRRVRDLDWHVHLNDSGPRIAQALAWFESAGVKLVIDHFGHPAPGKGPQCVGINAVLRSVAKGNTWVKLSAAYRLESLDVAAACAKRYLAEAGPERLLWGSDWPFAAFEKKVTYADTLKAFEHCVPDAAQRRIIGAETPLKLYFS